MEKNNVNGIDSVGYIFDRLFNSLESVIERMDKTDDDNKNTINEIKEDIDRAKAEYKRVLEHMDILTALSQNLSSGGVKDLVDDVKVLKTFMISYTAAEKVHIDNNEKYNKENKDKKELYIKIILALAGALLTVGGWVVRGWVTLSLGVPK